MQKYLRLVPGLLSTLVVLLLISGSSGAQEHTRTVLFGGSAVSQAAVTQTFSQPIPRLPVSLTQSVNLTIESSVAGCGTNPFAWYRAFDFGTLGLTNGLEVQSVDVGMFTVNTASNLVVNLYTSTTNPPTLASLTFVTGGQLALTPGTVDNTIVTVPVAASLPVGSILVVETIVPVGTPFVVAYNDNGETGPTYITGCGNPDITDLDDVDAASINWIMAVNGDDLLGDELVDNGGFETNLTPAWELKNASDDKVKCNTETKVVANTGLCAFQFKGGAGESSKIQQNVDLDGVIFTSTDTLALSVLVNAGKVTASGKVKVVIAYSDSEDRTKLTGTIATTVGYDDVTDSDVLLSTAVSKIKLQIKHSSPAGKVYIDDVSLAQVAGSPPLIPLP